MIVVVFLVVCSLVVSLGLDGVKVPLRLVGLYRSFHDHSVEIWPFSEVFVMVLETFLLMLTPCCCV